MFKHFLHIMIISGIIYLTFPRGNQQTCTPRLPALGGRHDPASSSQSWREQARRQVHLGISVFWQASRWEDPVLGAGEWQCFWNRSEHLKGQVLESGISAQKRAIDYCSWMLRFLVGSCGPTRHPVNRLISSHQLLSTQICKSGFWR